MEGGHTTDDGACGGLSPASIACCPPTSTVTALPSKVLASNLPSPLRGRCRGLTMQQRGSLQSAGTDAAQAKPTWVGESVLFFVIGVSGWWSLNAIQWAESPIFVAHTPEGAKVTNLLSVACQLGNFVPFLYKLLLSKTMQARILPLSVLLSQGIAIGAAAVCALFWEHTMVVAGHPHSVVLLVCTAVAGGVGCLSNVTYWALAVRYEGTHCTKAMSIGMTVGGLIVSWMATAAQKAGNSPRFPVSTFMLAVAGVQFVFLCSLCFVLGRGAGSGSGQPQPAPSTLGAPSHGEDKAGREGDGSTTPVSVLRARTASRVAFGASSGTLHISGSSSSSASAGAAVQQRDTQLTSPLLLVPPDDAAADKMGKTATATAPLPPPPPNALGSGAQHVVLAVMFVVYALTYSLPSLGAVMVQAYSKQQRGALLSLMNSFQQAGDVLGRTATAVPWVPERCPLLVMILTLLLLSVGFIAAAATSHDVPKVLTGDWQYLLPSLYFVYFFLRGYVVTVLYIWVKTRMQRAEAEHFTGTMGNSGQAGAFFANILLFLLVQFGDFFEIHGEWTGDRDHSSASGHPGLMDD